MTVESAYDMLDRVTNMVYRNASATVVGSFAYRYDALGLVTQKITSVGQASPPVTNFYACDALGRLVSAGGVSYSYDLAGNRLTAGTTNFTYSNNRLNGVLHDTAGNITNMVRGTVTLALSWNTLGQMVSVATNRVLAESYAYDPLGRRVKTTTGGTSVYHVYDGDECVADVDASGFPLRSYTWGLGIDNLLAMTVYAVGSTNSYYPVKDHLGSVHALVDVSGSLAASYAYDAWGNVLSTTINSSLLTLNSLRYLWQGREYSFVTGLYNFRARWYAPELGRWLSKDPIGLEGGLNLYVFCGNDPMNNIDPDGKARLTVYGNSRGDSKAIIVQRRASSSAYNSGHVWVAYDYIDSDGSVSTVNRGNYPASMGGYSDDSARNSDYSQAFYVPDSNNDSVLQELWTYDNFNPLDHNCVDSLEEVLDKAGIEHPSFGWPSDPRAVEDWLTGLKKPGRCK